MDKRMEEMIVDKIAEKLMNELLGISIKKVGRPKGKKVGRPKSNSENPKKKAGRPVGRPPKKVKKPKADPVASE